MANTYYVRMTGNDANAGTTPALAFRTITKLLSSTGFASGDTAYVGAGTYRESVTPTMTSALVETKVIGDVDGSHTGDAGEIILTAYTAGDTVASANQGLVLTGRSFLTFQDISFVGASQTIIVATTNTSTNITFTRCSFTAGGQGTNTVFTITSAANIALNWTWDSCIFLSANSSLITITPTRPASADFDLNILMKNCLFLGRGTISSGAGSGANTFNAGGWTIRNCTMIGGGGITTGTNWSTTFTLNVYNCFMYSGTTALSAGSAGQLVEDYNVIIGGGTPRSNVTAGTHSVSDGYAPAIFIGNEYTSVGSNLKPFGMPKPGSPLLGYANQAASPTVDILGVARPSGFVKLATGTATSGAANTITDTGATFGVNQFSFTTIKIVSGTGSGQTKTIVSHTTTVITVSGNWKTNPDSTSVYEIYQRATSSTGTFTAGSTTTGTDSNAAWGTNQWAGFTITTDSGTGSGQTLVVISNTSTVLTWAAATAVDSTTTYSLFKGASANVINAGVGCYENGQSAIQETVTVRTGTNSLRIPGAGYIDFVIPVNAASTSINIYAQYDAAYSGTLPSMSIVNGTECGVANATATQVGAASAWELLTLTFLPTSSGIITVRLISSSTTPTGNAFYDDFLVT